MKLILLRHGESQWNLENRFTGWKDVDLTSTGKEEAKFSAKQILSENLKISSIYSSILKRALETARIIIDDLSYLSKNELNTNWRLNERHYGALQGLNKSETAEKYGEKQVHVWRRSFDISPPKLEMDDKRHPRFNEKFKFIQPAELPNGESLKDVIARLKPFWDDFKGLKFHKDENHLIVAHSNSLRAIIKILEKLTPSEIMEINIPTGVPLVYELDVNFEIRSKKYLIKKDKLEMKKKLIIQQGRKK
tara:strand:- start:587 stop:1333 length:747 start_codon:yes stop_codon:yes gene_type:complete